MEKDAVVSRCEEDLEKAKHNHQSAISRLGKAKRGIVSWRGNVRPGIAAECASREVCIAALAEVVTKKEKALVAAIADQPRRDGLRVEIAKMQKEVDALEAENKNLHKKLAENKEAFSKKWDDLSRVMFEADHTPAEVQARKGGEAVNA